MIDRAEKVLSRLNLEAHSLKAFDQALDQIKTGMPVRVVQTPPVYQVSREVQDRQKERDRRTICRAREVAERFGMSDQTYVLHHMRKRIDEDAREVGFEEEKTNPAETETASR